MENKDKIRAMSDSELIEFFSHVSSSAGCPLNSIECCDDCEKCWGIYLNSVSEKSE